MEDATLNDERLVERVRRSVAAAITAGMLVAFGTFGLAFLIALTTDRDPASLMSAAGAFWGAWLIGLTLLGAMLGLAMAVPVHAARRWVRPGDRGAIFAVGAFGAVSLGLIAMTLGSDLSLPLSFAAPLAATGLGGVFFSALFWRWAWVEPCAS